MSDKFKVTPLEGRSLIIRNFPLELRAAKRWVVWRKIGNKTIPFSPLPKGGLPHAASPTDYTTWGTLQQALIALTEGVGEGLSFAVGDEITGIDLDWKEAGVKPKWADQIIARMNTYTEYSPSKMGCHIFLVGRLKTGAGRRKKLEGGEVEVYSEGRFLRVTDDPISPPPFQVRERQDALEALEQELFPPKVARVFTGYGYTAGDADLLEKALRSKAGAQIQDLLEGNLSHYGDGSKDGYDRSRADFALARCLAFWTGNNPEQLRRLMFRSALRREKWEQGEYLTRTIESAIRGAKFYRGI